MQGPRRGAARAYREASLPLSYKYRGAKVGFRSAYQGTHGQTHTHKPRRGVRGRRSQTVKHNLQKAADTRGSGAGERGYRGMLQ